MKDLNSQIPVLWLTIFVNFLTHTFPVFQEFYRDKYHSTIKAMKMHKRTCVEYEGESDDEDEENEDDYAQIQFIDDNDVDIIGDNEAFEIIYWYVI